MHQVMLHVIPKFPDRSFLRDEMNMLSPDQEEREKKKRNEAAAESLRISPAANAKTTFGTAPVH